jgi:prolyl-tRNA synthetase
VGFAGPVGLKALVIVDQAVTVMHNAVTGANKTDYHITGVEPGRDFPLATESPLPSAGRGQGEGWQVADIRTAVEGDRAPNGSPLVFKKCIEVGHVFKLGTKYSDAMEATCLDQNGKARPFIMGCYGIGLNRIVAAAIESHHDDKGISWPMSIAPFHVVICALDTREEQVVSLSQKLHDELVAAGIDVILDDRDARPGFKFADADLIGFPIRVVVGKKGLAEGMVEIHSRGTGETRKVPPEAIALSVCDAIAAAARSERAPRSQNGATQVRGL